MKSEHRRELHANELEKLAETIGKFFERHGMKVLLGLIAAIAMGVGAYWIISRWNRDEVLATSQLNRIYLPSADPSAPNTIQIPEPTAESFLTIADDANLAGTKTASLARLRAADLQLQQGIQLYFENRDAGLEELKAARENYQRVLDADDLPNWARERARYGFAVATETMSNGDTSDALAAYQELLSAFPESIYQPIAEERIRALQREDTKEFYAFLSAQDRRFEDLETPEERRRKKLRQIHGGRTVSEAEKPVELPRIPAPLQLNLDESSGTTQPKTPAIQNGPKTTPNRPQSTAPLQTPPPPGKKAQPFPPATDSENTPDRAKPDRANGKAKRKAEATPSFGNATNNRGEDGPAASKK